MHKLTAAGLLLCCMVEPMATHAAEVAISDPVKKAELHFKRAYALNESQKYEQALEDLNAACDLVPHHALYLHERAYTLNSLGRYQDALADLNEQVRLEPQSAGAYDERAMTRTHLGDWQGAFEDRDRDVQLQTDSMSAMVARARARLWIGQLDGAREDLKASVALNGSPSNEDTAFRDEVAAQVDAWALHSSGPDFAAKCRQASDNADYANAALIGDCTIAFLSAKTPVAQAEALTQRAIAWLVARQSQHDATTDYEAAAALDPNNPNCHTNLAFAYIQERHSWAARHEFDRSIAIRRTYLAVAGRASAHYNLGERDLAFADASASFKMQPNELALFVLGDLAKDKGQDTEAKSFWMGAYQLGSRDDRLMERLKTVGVADPAAETHAAGVSATRSHRISPDPPD